MPATRRSRIVRRAAIALAVVVAIPLWWLGFLMWSQAMYTAGWMPPAIRDSPLIQVPWYPALWMVNQNWFDVPILWSIDCGTSIGEAIRE